MYVQRSRISTYLTQRRIHVQLLKLVPEFWHLSLQVPRRSGSSSPCDLHLYSPRAEHRVQQGNLDTDLSAFRSHTVRCCNSHYCFNNRGILALSQIAHPTLRAPDATILPGDVTVPAIRTLSGAIEINATLCPPSCSTAIPTFSERALTPFLTRRIPRLSWVDDTCLLHDKGH